MSRRKTIPVIDLFAGPGGLGEGFSVFRDTDGSSRFQIARSIEKDPTAHRTLLLRTFLRELSDERLPHAYYQFLRNLNEPEKQRFEKLFAGFPREAETAGRKAMRAELGVDDPNKINRAISLALQGSKECVLIGGPPCQAYSLAGRSRNKGVERYIASEDRKQYLYVEYLQIIADHAPALFVMENVKGLLSATVNDLHIFNRIIEDLKDPVRALTREGRKPAATGTKHRKIRYRIHSLVAPANNGSHDPSDFVVRMEKYGIPQSRHRIILIGIREDLGNVKPANLVTCNPVPVSHILEGLPRVRSGLSRETDSDETWIRALEAAKTRRWFTATKNKAGKEVYKLLNQIVGNIRSPIADRGAEFVPYTPRIAYRADWYLDKKLDGVCNHSTRSHMTQDLFRYLYASCFAVIHGRSPTLRDFPGDLLPEHSNAEKALDGGNFSDRFRVQIESSPSTTITSHISKDGHYYIHPDPSQCRSLTVREAARLQTFPDNYFFCGPRTSQYIQVGNAVPPLLAHQIAKIVSGVLKKSGVA